MGLTSENKKGEVTLDLVINRDGEIAVAEVAASFGFADLDRAALAGVSKVHNRLRCPTR